MTDELNRGPHDSTGSSSPRSARHTRVGRGSSHDDADRLADPTEAEICESIITHAIERYDGWNGAGGIPTAVERAIAECEADVTSSVRNSVLDAVMHDTDLEATARPGMGVEPPTDDGEGVDE